ncbi:MAG TPA: arginase family protein [Longimicrobium sp.]|nr:arginase family protein [Longimicrobium sp.]
MDIRLIIVPCDSGIPGWRMGAGPDHLLRAGAADRLRDAGHAVTVDRIELPSAAPEIAAAFAIAAGLSERVSAARAEGAFPIVLAGNCATAMGTLAGLVDADPAVLWLDAHADLNTPETTRSGMLDGMALAIATGRCWPALAASIPGFRAIPDAHVCLVGARDVDAGEADLLRRSALTVIAPADVPVRLSAALDTLRTRTETVYLHVDLDVLDPGEGTVNAFAAPDGLRLDDVLELIAAVRSRFRLGAVALTAYDPSFDTDGRIAAAAIAILHALTRPGGT